MLEPKAKNVWVQLQIESSCPFNGDCLAPKVVYCTDVTNEVNNDQKLYFGLAEITFKEHYNNHKQDVKHIKY